MIIYYNYQVYQPAPAPAPAYQYEAAPAPYEAPTTPATTTTTTTTAAYERIPVYEPQRYQYQNTFFSNANPIKIDLAASGKLDFCIDN